MYARTKSGLRQGEPRRGVDQECKLGLEKKSGGDRKIHRLINR